MKMRGQAKTFNFSPIRIYSFPPILLHFENSNNKQHSFKQNKHNKETALQFRLVLELVSLLSI